MDEQRLRREPPESAKQALRTEVGFGCPVPDCREPFLSWHHFDPPWYVRNHHDPAGMIALCVKHHAMADRGVFSNGQLRGFKTAANAVRDVTAKFEWARPKQLVRLGGFYMGTRGGRMAFEVGGREEEVVAITEGNGGVLELSFALRDARSDPVARMRQNSFVGHPEQLFDLEVDCGATSIRIRAAKLQVVLSLQSRRVTREELRRRLEEDWARAQVSLSNRHTPAVWRDSIMGTLIPVPQAGQPVALNWRDPASGQAFESRERLVGQIYDWAMTYCLDDEGRVPLLDFRNLVTHLDGHTLTVRDGVDSGSLALNFGYYFSPDMPPLGEEYRSPPKYLFPGS
jgi:hypothetical protein